MIFISHSVASVKDAIEFKNILLTLDPKKEIFLSSDWESIPSGSNWLQEIETALQKCTEFIVLIVSGQDFCKLWINYEIGFARGKGLKPKIFKFGGVELSKARYPILGIQWIDTGDTNRWVGELKSMGFNLDTQTEKNLATLFKQNS